MDYLIAILLFVAVILLAAIAYGVSIFVLRAQELCEDERKMVKKTIVISGGIVMCGQFLMALGVILGVILTIHYIANH